VETWVIHERMFEDEAFRQFSHIGQLTFIKLFRLCDRNWGHTLVGDLRCLAADLWPHEKAAVLQGDDEAIEVIVEAERQLRLGCELSLLILEETRDGDVIGFRSWESYTGAKRLQRAAPEFPMGPRLAATRNWSKAHHKGRAILERWAARLDLTTLVFGEAQGKVAERSGKVADSSDKLDDSSERVDEGSERLVVHPGYQGTRVPGYQGPGGLPKPSTDTLPSTVTMLSECIDFVRDATGVHPREAWVTWRKSCVPPPTLAELLEVTACESVEQWMLGLAIEAKGGKPEFKRKNFADAMLAKQAPSPESRARAAAMLAGQPSVSPTEGPVVVVGVDDWLAGGERLKAAVAAQGGAS
jgi:hypothetical protein